MSTKRNRSPGGENVSTRPEGDACTVSSSEDGTILHLRTISRIVLVRTTLLVLVGIAVAAAWASNDSFPEGTIAKRAMAQSSPLSPLNPVADLLPGSAAAATGALSLTPNRIILPWVSAVLLLMLASVLLAFWRRP